MLTGRRPTTRSARKATGTYTSTAEAITPLAEADSSWQALHANALCLMHDCMLCMLVQRSPQARPCCWYLCRAGSCISLLLHPRRARVTCWTYDNSGVLEIASPAVQGAVCVIMEYLLPRGKGAARSQLVIWSTMCLTALRRVSDPRNHLRPSRRCADKVSS